MPDLWRNLGTVEPDVGVWQLFPNSSISGKVFTVTFGNLTALTVKTTFTHAILRRQYQAAFGETIIEKGFAIYPTIETFIFSNPIPAEYQDRGLIVSDWGIKLVVNHGKRRRLFLEEPIYTVTLMES